MFLHKISEYIYILPIWLLTVSNQIVNNVKNALKQPHHMNLIFYIGRKSVTFKPRQDKTRHDKAWQGKARRGQTRQDEAAPRQEGVPWFWKILVWSWLFAVSCSLVSWRYLILLPLSWMVFVWYSFSFWSFLFSSSSFLLVCLELCILAEGVLWHEFVHFSGELYFF